MTLPSERKEEDTIAHLLGLEHLRHQLEVGDQTTYAHVLELSGEEFARAVGLIAAQPAIGVPCRKPGLAHVRRVHLDRAQYYLYYRVVPDPVHVQVVAFWHSSRRMKPGS